jgi:ribonucrease Y
MTDMIVVSLISILGALGTGGVVYFLMSKNLKAQKQSAEQQKASNKQISETVASAETQAQKIILDAKDSALKIKEEAEREVRSARSKLIESERKTEQRLDELYSRIKETERKEEEAKSTQNKWKQKLTEVEDLRNKQIQKLESIASMTKKEAQELILKNVEKTLESEITKKIKESQENLELEVDKKAKEILVEAMHNASTDYVAEYTISNIQLPDEEMKGRIIGKEGRNIRAFEDITGVNIDFEDENIVRLSSFDSVRREIARRSMEILIKDGRIHPARIEEVVDKTTKEINKIILEAGEKLCQEVGVYNLPKELVEKLGNFKFRTSYGQNMIMHTLEETKIGVKIAHEIGANIPITKLACLLHDIGKVITDKEGNHIELGAEYLKKFKLPQSVISAVEEHHTDNPTTLEGVIVQIADSISGSRPGARYEDYEKFVERMKSLEQAALSFEGVEKAFAISAGREVRVIVIPEEVDDNAAVKLSYDIANKIENEQTYPGTVKIVVIRELRSVATAS